MVNNTTNIERMGFISKHTTNFPQTKYGRTTPIKANIINRLKVT